jgi:uncharacterized Zn-binding protein involved in type VI secretion
VNVNRRPALRVDDPGVHAACCGQNTWVAQAGSATVFINCKAAHRIGDATRHCGGPGQLVEGSPNVIVGETTSAGVTSRNQRLANAALAQGYARLSSSLAELGIDSNSETAADSEPARGPEPARSSEPTTVDLRAQADVLRAAAHAHAPFCEVCQRAGAPSA